jgi:predicted nucleic acid-binding protein
VTARRFVDTNVLIYSISTAPNEARKRERALSVLEGDDCGLSVQVLQEFYAQSTRPTRPGALTHETAVGLIRTWMRFPLQDNTSAILVASLEIKAAYNFSYWDCAIIAAARALGCPELLTEDMSHGRRVEGITILNPFR